MWGKSVLVCCSVCSDDTRQTDLLNTSSQCSQPASNYNSNLLAGWNVTDNPLSLLSTLPRPEIILSLSSWSESLQQIHLTVSTLKTNNQLNIQYCTGQYSSHYNCPAERLVSILPYVWWRDTVLAWQSRTRELVVSYWTTQSASSPSQSPPSVPRTSHLALDTVQSRAVGNNNMGGTELIEF